MPQLGKVYEAERHETGRGPAMRQRLLFFLLIASLALLSACGRVCVFGGCRFYLFPQ